MLFRSGTLWAWGVNWYGQLGNGTTAEQHIPVQIGTDNDWESVLGGNSFTIAKKVTNTLWSWGSNWYGQLGYRVLYVNPAPAKIDTDVDWHSYGTGYEHVLAVTVNDSIWSWGENVNGQGGDKTKTNHYAPQSITLSTCTIYPESTFSESNGGNYSITVNASMGHSWNAISNVGWITITNGSSGVGSGTIDYVIAGNTNANVRVGTLTIGGNAFTVTQAGDYTTLWSDDFNDGAQQTWTMYDSGDNSSALFTNGRF